MAALVTRTWQDVGGQKWIGVLCHEGEQATGDESLQLVDTGKYQDYRIEQVINRCVVGIVVKE